MASGNVTFSNGVSVTASSNTCSAVRIGLQGYFNSVGANDVIATSCSSDPVAVGTYIYNEVNGSPYNTYTVSTIGATADPSPDVVDAEAVSVLIIVIALIACFFAGVFGYRDGRIA